MVTKYQKIIKLVEAWSYGSNKFEKRLFLKTVYFGTILGTCKVVPNI